MIQIRIYENVKVYQVYTQKYIQENYYGFKKMILLLGCFSVFDFKTDTTLRYELLYSFVVLCLSSKIKIEWILNQLELTQILICAWWRVLSRY